MEFRVIDLSTEVIQPEPTIVQAHTAEHAAELALGVELVRSGSKQNLRARVYYQKPGAAMSMVRLYTKVADARGE